MILEWILRKQISKLWNRCIWLMMRTDVGPLWKR